VEHYVGIDVAQLLRMGLSVREMPGNLPVPQRSSLFAY
jgi:hypothetical protein